MTRAILIFALMLALPAQANTLMDTLKSGADAVVDTTKKGVGAVDRAITSTNDLVRDEDTPEATRAKLDTMEAEILARLLTENPEAAKAYGMSAGYAAFDMRRVTVFPLQGGYGRGVAVAPDGQRTYMQMGTGGVGAAFGIGGFESQFVIMFETPVDFTRFVQHGYEASADAGAMQGHDHTATEVQFTEGRSFFVLDKTGWRVNANANGTRYWQDADLN